MTNRQILHFPGAPSIPGYPVLDVTEAEIAVANISGLVYWPGMFNWDVPASKDKFLDRMTDAACPVFGVVDVSASFALSANGKLAYNIATLNHAPKTAFDTSGSFTVGMIVRDKIAFGSFSNPATAGDETWYVLSETAVNADTGKIRFSFGDIAGVYSNYTGPLLSTANMSYVVFIIDRATGTAKIRVNGAPAFSSVNTGIMTKAVIQELRVGGAVSAANALVPRYGHYASAIAFSRALSGADLASLETMLAEAAG